MKYPLQMGAFVAALIFLSAAPVFAASVSSITCTEMPFYVDTCSYTGKDTGGAPAYWFYNTIGDTPRYSGLFSSGEPSGTRSNIPNANLNCAMPPFGTDIALYADIGGTTLLCGTRFDCATNARTLFGPCATPTPTPAPASPVTGGSNMGVINVVKIVINDNGGTKTFSDFPLFVNGTPVISGISKEFPAPAGVYSVTESGDAGYVRSYSGDCDAAGQLNLNPGDSRFCVITNDDIGQPVALPPEPPLIDIVKVPNPLALPGGPGPVEYTYILRNIGTVPVTNVTLIGDSCLPIMLVSGDILDDRKLDVGEIWVFRCTTKLTQTHTNTVVATGWSGRLSASDIASATVVVGVPGLPDTGIAAPLIHVVKIPSALTLRVGGGMITYTNTVTNPGTVPLSHVRLQDDKCGDVKFLSGDANGNMRLDTNETWLFTCRSKLLKTTTNTVTAFGEANGMTVKDVAIATVIVATAPLKKPSALPPLTQQNATSSSPVAASSTNTAALILPPKRGASADTSLMWSLTAAGVLAIPFFYLSRMILGMYVSPKRKR